jgi:hypothetical protein
MVLFLKWFYLHLYKMCDQNLLVVKLEETHFYENKNSQAFQLAA